eukprot:2251105-Pyramimonas_sp.AAC.1
MASNRLRKQLFPDSFGIPEKEIGERRAPDNPLEHHIQHSNYLRMGSADHDIRGTGADQFRITSNIPLGTDD